MKFIDLTILGFGKFHDIDMEFSDGLNVIYGKNEAGKSTLHTFIRGMLFGIEKKPGRASKTDLYTKYEPWEKGGIYEGRMRISYGGKIYRIERIFQKSMKSLKVINETDGLSLPDPKAFLTEALGGLSETAFTNTVSIGQLKCATESGMVAELKNYIANLNTSGDMNLNISNATDYLKKQRKAFEAKLVPEAAKTYSALIGEIRNIEREISQPEYENQLVHYTELKKDAGARVLQMHTEKETLLQKIASNEQVLKFAGFHSQSEIQDCQAEAEALYERWTAAKALHEKPGRIALPICMLILGLLAAIGALLVTGAGYPQLLQLPGIFMTEKITWLSSFLANFFVQPAILISAMTAIALILFVCGLLSFVSSAKNTRQFRQTTTALSELFHRHIGSPDISPEAMDSFCSRMKEMLSIESSLNTCKSEVQDLTTALTQVNAEEQAYGEQLQRQQRSQWELEQKLEHLTNVKNRAEQLNRILAENDEITQEIDAINLALETMTDLSMSIRSSFGHYLNKEASDLISGITGGIYNSMSIDENLNVFMNTPKKLVPVDQVSSGTMDQIYLALRLAAAKLIQGDTEPLPLIFDDSFAMYDDERLRAALSWLGKAYSAQILLFTCHHREHRLLQEASVPHHLIQM